MSLITKKLNAAPATPAAAVKPALGGLGGKKLGGLKKLNAQPKEIDIDESVEETSPATKVIPKAGSAKPKLGGGLKKLGAKKEEPKEEVVAEETTEEVTPAEELPTFVPAEEKPAKPKIGASKLGKKIEPKEVEIEEAAEPVEAETLEVKNESGETTLSVDEEGNVEVEAKEEEVKEELTPQQKAAQTRKKNAAKKKAVAKTTEEEVVASLEVDESKRVSIEEMDAIMRPIVAPTTELWEQEKKDVLEALDNIKVEQDMEMSQVKEALADLDELNFMVLPKLHDAETMYDGTKQNYDTVKAVAIAKGNATNAEGRKAEGILACQNFVTPSGAVVDLHQYMLLIEERYKFYQKIQDGISFKKYSLINYNNALKIESRS